jgi:hypothetical protein
MHRLLLVALVAFGTLLLSQLPTAAGPTLRFLDVRETVEFLDVPPAATSDFDPTPGDTFFFSNRLRNEADTKDRGRFVAKCVAMIGTEFKCAGTLMLLRGTIELASTVDFASSDPIVASVVGGTGRFVGAGGSAVFTSTGMAGTSELVVVLA